MRLEDAGHDIFWNPVSVVFHHDRNAIGLAGNLDMHATGVSQASILQKIQHNLPEIVGPSHS
jgi:hypothetical protein